MREREREREKFRDILKERVREKRDTSDISTQMSFV